MINVSKLYCGMSSGSDWLRYSGENSFGPVVVFNCTDRCNLQCRHCYSFSEYKDGFQRHGSLSGGGGELLTMSEAKRLLSEFVQVGCPVVLFSGGEPLLHKDIYELLRTAGSLGLRTVLSTNGTLIDSDAARHLVLAGVSYVGISVDGGEEFHDDFRGSVGCFKAAIGGIENCRREGLRTGLRFTITRSNMTQVPVVYDIAVSAGVRRICFYHLIRTGRAKQLDDQVPSPEQTRGIIEVIIERTDQLVQRGLIDEVLTVGNHADGPYILLKMSAGKKHLYAVAERLLRVNGGNRIGEKICCVSWDGSVHPDQFWRNYCLGNIRHNSFASIWERSDPVLIKLRNKSRFAGRRCLGCRWFDYCRGNFRFLGFDSSEQNWLNEPACYLTDDEVAV